LPFFSDYEGYLSGKADGYEEGVGAGYPCSVSSSDRFEPVPIVHRQYQFEWLFNLDCLHTIVSHTIHAIPSSIGSPRFKRPHASRTFPTYLDNARDIGIVSPLSM